MFTVKRYLDWIPKSKLPAVNDAINKAKDDGYQIGFKIIEEHYNGQPWYAIELVAIDIMHGEKYGRFPSIDRAWILDEAGKKMNGNLIVFNHGDLENPVEIVEPKKK